MVCCNEILPSILNLIYAGNTTYMKCTNDIADEVSIDDLNFYVKGSLNKINL